MSTSITGGITVFAAASLKSTFTELGEQFEKDYTGTKVTFSFAGSSDLVTQLTQGAPADVFASADTKNMIKATDAGLVTGEPVNFASNTLAIVTPPGTRNTLPPLPTWPSLELRWWCARHKFPAARRP
jgi:molybdate transport system substrate-binding protein